MKYYTVTVAFDPSNGSEQNFKKLLESMCEKKEALRIRPKRQTSYESEVCFFSNTHDASYEEFMDLAINDAELKLNVISINSIGTIKDSISKAKDALNKLQQTIDAIDNTIYTPEELNSSEILEGNNTEEASPVTVEVEVPEADVQNETTDQPENNIKSSDKETDEVEPFTKEELSEEKAPTEETAEAKEENPREGQVAFKNPDNTPAEDATSEEEYYDEDEDEDLESALTTDDEIDYDDSEPEDQDKADNTDSKDKRYSQKYEYLMTYKEFEELGDKKQLTMESEVGYDATLRCAIEDTTVGMRKDCKSYSAYEEKYPEMKLIDEAHYWFVSYMNYAKSAGVYEGYNKKYESIMTFDSFIRAKLNGDIDLEPQVSKRIDELMNKN